MDAFLIDGKTPEEIWGRKYKDVRDPGMKERCLQFEVLKKITAGDTEVRAKVFADQSYDAEWLREMLTSGQLKDQVIGTIMKQTAEKAKVRSNVMAGQKPAARRENRNTNRAAGNPAR